MFPNFLPSSSLSFSIPRIRLSISPICSFLLPFSSSKLPASNSNIWFKWFKESKLVLLSVVKIRSISAGLKGEVPTSTKVFSFPSQYRSCSFSLLTSERQQFCSSSRWCRRWVSRLNFL